MVGRQLQLGDLNVGGVDTDVDGCGQVGLLALHLVDVDDPLEAQQAVTYPHGLSTCRASRGLRHPCARDGTTLYWHAAPWRAGRSSDTTDVAGRLEVGTTGLDGNRT